MPTVFSVDPGRCSQKTEVRAEIAEGGKIKVRITSSCKNVQRYSEKLTEVSIKDISKPILSNPIYIAANSSIGPECLVPCGVVAAVWTEGGMISKNLLKNYPNSCVKYEE